MAKFVILNPNCTINGVNLTNRVAAVEIKLGRADVDVTASGASGVQRLPGLKDEAFTFTFTQDYAASNVDATLFPLYNNGTEFLVAVSAQGSVVSTTNPEYEGTCILTEYVPLTGEIGARGEATVTMPVTGYVTRNTT